MLNFSDPPDLCTIFGNTLENAIESCEQISAPADRQISIRAIKKASGRSHIPKHLFAQARFTKQPRLWSWKYPLSDGAISKRMHLLHRGTGVYPDAAFYD
jgi:hypothetical protein